jgi:hypothetical protein
MRRSQGRRPRNQPGTRADERGVSCEAIDRAAAILIAICMALAAGWTGMAATAQAAGTALPLSSSSSTYTLDPATGQLSVLLAKGGIR